MRISVGESLAWMALGIVLMFVSGFPVFDLEGFKVFINHEGTLFEMEVGAGILLTGFVTLAVLLFSLLKAPVRTLLLYAFVTAVCTLSLGEQMQYHAAAYGTPVPFGYFDIAALCALPLYAGLYAFSYGYVGWHRLWPSARTAT